MSSPWWILGSGAVGCLWAVQLQRAGAEVNIIRSPARQLEDNFCSISYQPAGTSSSENDGKTAASSHRFRQYHALGCPPTIKRLLVCTKAYAVVDALQPLQAALTDGADIVLLVNGMGFHDAVATRFARQNIFAAVTTAGAWLKAPLHVVAAGSGDTSLGALHSSAAASAASNRVASELGHTGMPVSASSSMHEVIWQKVCINAAINGLTAIYQCRNGELLEHSVARPKLDNIIGELRELSTAQGLQPLATTIESIVHGVIRSTASNYSSTYQDIKQGRDTEIDYINGYVCRLAAELNIAVPHNAALIDTVHKLASTKKTKQD